MFSLIYVDMFMEDDIYFAKHFFWAGLNTFAAGIAAFRIYQDMICTFVHFTISFSGPAVLSRVNGVYLCMLWKLDRSTIPWLYPD